MVGRAHVVGVAEKGVATAFDHSRLDGEGALEVCIERRRDFAEHRLHLLVHRFRRGVELLLY